LAFRDKICAKRSEALRVETSSPEVSDVDSVVYRTAAAADISSSRSIHVRSVVDPRSRGVQACEFPGSGLVVQILVMKVNKLKRLNPPFSSGLVTRLGS
jgi:hypothetical protein